MRVKTEHQREAILAAALAVFQEDGYERASMNKVASRLGGSKATLYGYFSSKEDLFAAAMLEAVKADAVTAFEPLWAGQPQSLETALTHFGQTYLEFQLRQGMLELTRLSLAEGREGSLGVRLYEEGVRRGWELFAGFLGSNSKGNLDQKTAWKIAIQFKFLLSGDLVELRLRGVIDEVSSGQILEASEEAVRMIKAGWPEAFATEVVVAEASTE